MSRESVQSLNDEKLMAYVNGVLTESERIEVEEALGIDHEFRLKLEEISRAAEHVDDILRNVRDDGQPFVVSAVNDQPEPGAGEAKQVDIVEGYLPLSAESGQILPDESEEVCSAAVAQAHIAVPHSREIETDRQPATEQATPAIFPAAHGSVVDSGRGVGWLKRAAVLVAVLVAGFGGYYYDHVMQPSAVLLSSNLVEPASPLFQALQITPSQELYRTDAGDIVLPSFSFKSADGRYCRQFEINSGQVVSLGLACHQDRGWRIEMLLVAGERPVGSAVFQPVSNRYKEVMSTVFERLWGGSHLNQVEERAALARGWSSPVAQ